MVKINGPRQAQRARKTRRNGRATGAEFAPEAKPNNAAQDVGGASEVSAAVPLDGLIALQSDGGGKAAKRAAAERALMLLDRIRDGLLEGRVRVSDLESLADAASAKGDSGDAALDEIYDQVAMRALIEVAKLEIAIANNSAAIVFLSTI